MSRSLDLASSSFTSQPPELTVFAPADEAFPYSGPPSLNLLRYQLLPVTFHLRSLKSLPFGAKIGTLLDGYSLTVTTLPADGLVSLNNVTVTASPIFDDGSLIIYGTNRFFDPYFRISGPIPSYGRKNRCCLAPRNPNETAEMAETAAFYPFSDASKVLTSEGCSVMASFLEMQFHGFLKSLTKLTVFAPVDHAMVSRIGDLSQYSSLFRRHVAPCKLSWNDLVSLDDGTVLRTNLQGFLINVSRYDGVLVLNGVSVIMPEMYHNDWLVVHGISEVLEFLPESPPEQVVATSPDSASSPESDEVSPDESPLTEPADEAIEVPSSPKFDSGDLEEFEASDSTEMFANMTEDEAAISHRRFFVYRPE
ncbi:PREDICTED: putative fasciclin-like arabinogalactan protein 20 [Fragaria vesca subsp. vesca]|uniref:putative fasciclin-like arabinogalactan protein 20 n=1 Tax=Fragaria vesca subsp. vesca TaxID=101020 RepID=UPI0002C372EC|nr:PREDICTED: putative fasciclin-like arabinogalactan protein 20 [Fragaria vesca subsp. vesca]